MDWCLDLLWAVGARVVDRMEPALYLRIDVRVPQSRNVWWWRGGDPHLVEIWIHPSIPGIFRAMAMNSCANSSFAGHRYDLLTPPGRERDSRPEAVGGDLPGDTCEGA